MYVAYLQNPNKIIKISNSGVYGSARKEFNIESPAVNIGVNSGWVYYESLGINYTLFNVKVR